MSSGVPLARWPSGGRLWLTDKLLDLSSQIVDGEGEWLSEAALMGVHYPPSKIGRLVVFGDSNCMDTVRTVEPCWQLMRHMLLCASGGEPPPSVFWERGWGGSTWREDHEKFLSLLSAPLHKTYVAPGNLGTLPENSHTYEPISGAKAHLRRGRPSMSTSNALTEVVVSASDFELNSNSPFFSGDLTCSSQTE